VQQARRRLTYANVVSSLALFIALGGATAFAVQQLPEKSVGERQLRPGAVTSSKLRKNAVTAPKIKALAVKNGKLANGSVTTPKLGNGAVTGEKIAGGAVTGEKIASDAVTGDKVVESSLSEVPSASKSSSATTAQSANPVVFARINSDGFVDPSNSKGLTDANVDSPQLGVYCISVPAFAPRGGQATAQSEGGNKETIAQIKAGGTGECPAPQVEVRTWNAGKAETVKAAFYVMLYH
jgi:hypothetical protein